MKFFNISNGKRILKQQEEKNHKTVQTYGANEKVQGEIVRSIIIFKYFIIISVFDIESHKECRRLEKCYQSI